MKRKGIILAGGTGSRLHPLTISVSKQLMPVFDKPMIYYPLATLMLAGIEEILVITTPEDSAAFQKLLGDGSHWGLSISFAIQPSPDGLAQAFVIGAEFLDSSPAALILGDNIFFGHGLPAQLSQVSASTNPATVFAYHVNDPERYGVVSFDAQGKADSLIEKPIKPASNYAVTGLYFYDNSVVRRAHDLRPSQRGELEITDLNRSYLDDGLLSVEIMGRGVAWLDTGTHESLLEASQFIQILEKRQGLRVCCPEEIAFEKGLISANQLAVIADSFGSSPYGKYLHSLVPENVV